jgi:hypothetical protein
MVTRWTKMPKNTKKIKIERFQLSETLDQMVERVWPTAVMGLPPIKINAPDNAPATKEGITFFVTRAKVMDSRGGSKLRN